MVLMLSWTFWSAEWTKDSMPSETRASPRCFRLLEKFVSSSSIMTNSGGRQVPGLCLGEKCLDILQATWDSMRTSPIDTTFAAGAGLSGGVSDSEGRTVFGKLGNKDGDAGLFSDMPGTVCCVKYLNGVGAIPSLPFGGGEDVFSGGMGNMWFAYLSRYSGS
jgi:hypothetical protein